MAQANQNTGTATGGFIKTDNIASTLILEDHMKGILSKAANQNYKPWKAENVPRNPHSPFGDFPSEFLKVQKIENKKHAPIHEDSQACNSDSKCFM